MRRAVLATAAVVLLAGPTALAFKSGGYFTQPRLIAAIVAWLLVLAVTIVGPAPLPRTLPGRLALGGLVAITVWSALSLTWAPLSEAATANVERLMLYVGALMLAIGVLRAPRALRAVEPALAAGATIVIGQGLSERLVPGLVDLGDSPRAAGRLEQPITYWNAEGALAAMGFVLCARLAGDRSRPLAVRILAAAAAGPLATGVYLSYSRGAIAVAVIGLGLLVAFVPLRSQVRAASVVLAAGVIAAASSSFLPGVASLQGSLGSRERDGAVMLVVLMLVAAAAGLLTASAAVRERRKPAMERRLVGARAALAVAAALAGLALAGLAAGGLREKGDTAATFGARADRLASVQSNRYEYWRVGVRAFVQEPLRGLGSGGYRVFWLRERPISDHVNDVHSLELEMAAELGLVGVLAFAAMIAGFALAAREALRRRPALASGPTAAAIVWLLHASIDWDWQLPAVTLPAIVLGGALVVLSEQAGRRPDQDDPGAARETPGQAVRSARHGRRAISAG